MQHNPSAKGLRNKGWPHYEALQGIIPAHTSNWTGFHASTSLAVDTSTPTATGSDITNTTTNPSADAAMLSLESALDRVEFRDLDDIEMSSAPIPHDILPIPTPITPVTPRGFNAAIEPFVAPSISTPASSTAVKRKNEGDDGERHKSRPPHSSKGKSMAGSSKSQRLTMPVALKEMAGEVASSITSAGSALQDTITGRLAEPVSIRKQRAMLRVQEEKDLDDYEVVAMINLFQSDVATADAYNSITRDGIRRIFLAQHLQEPRRVRANDQELL